MHCVCSTAVESPAPKALVVARDSSARMFVGLRLHSARTVARLTSDYTPDQRKLV
jgi:hypothetical protein